MEQKNIEAVNELGRKFSDTTILLHEQIAARSGLSGTDHKYLGILMQHGAMTAGELAGFTGLTTGAVTGLVDRLEKKKLVKRTADKQDRRKIMIVPNYENTMKLMGEVFTDLQQRMMKLMATFTEKETEIIEKYLRSTIAVMQGMIEDLKVERGK